MATEPAVIGCLIGIVFTGIPVTVLGTTGGGAIATEIREINVRSSFIYEKELSIFGMYYGLWFLCCKYGTSTYLFDWSFQRWILQPNPFGVL